MSNTERMGVWLIGARGAVATCVVFGAHALRRGLVPPDGMVTAMPEFRDLPWVDPGTLIFGGHDVRELDLLTSARSLAATGILPPAVIDACADDIRQYENAIRPGVIGASELDFVTNGEVASARREGHPALQLAAVEDDLKSFREQNGLDRVIVVHLASTEPVGATVAALEGTPDDLDRAIDRGEAVPPSVIYARAALGQGSSYVNFTPSHGASGNALRTLAKERGAVQCGRDGKTGETLLKTVLAPMFLRRNLRVLSWQGYNMLGNTDGRVLEDPEHKDAKLRNKNAALEQILEHDTFHTKTGIDYVPSLGDWKTAWDYIHFQGFLGARMSLQFTWHGSDSALAAPLVIDLIRLVELSQRAGLSGVLHGAAPFFKSPIEVAEHDFFQQHARFVGLCEDLREHFSVGGPDDVKPAATTR